MKIILKKIMSTNVSYFFLKFSITFNNIFMSFCVNFPIDFNDFEFLSN